MMDGPGGDERALSYAPWTLDESVKADPALAERVEERLRDLRAAGHRIGRDCYVAPDTVVGDARLVLGDHSYLAAQTHVTGEVAIGQDCSVNLRAIVRGRVKIGDGTRIGSQVSILGFNHSTSPDLPIRDQPLTSRGISIGRDVWIGNGAVVLDGVAVGAHAVIGAGAVVAHDVPAWAVAVGNPARVVRDRRGATREDSPARDPRSGARNRAGDRLACALGDLGESARDQVGRLLAACWRSDAVVDAVAGVPDWRPCAGWFAASPAAGAAIDTRAQCDAIELAMLLAGEPPSPMSGTTQAKRLQGLQRTGDGLVAEIGPGTDSYAGAGLADGILSYTTLATAYALDLLGARLPRVVGADPVGGGAGRVVGWLDALPWATDTWGAGHLTDGLGTALLFGSPTGGRGSEEALIGWLVTHADPRTGMWGTEGAGPGAQGMRGVVNGCYRTIRGTFAARGLPLPYPERLIDALLEHARDPRWFGEGRLDACNVLDTANLLWLAGFQTEHRRDEVRSLAEGLLTRVLPQWRGRDANEAPGFPFALTPDAPVTLQGTEMWLAIIWHLADLCGRAGSLGFAPRGVHRPPPHWQEVWSSRLRERSR
jgi:acetyltransferase-like isoleucine patch superfamily enzyme